MQAMNQPNFFLVGAPKAGSTSLYHHLRQHPEIYMSPIKEPSYFSLEMRPENFAPVYRPHAYRRIEETREFLRGPMNPPITAGIVTTWEDYLRLFTAAKNHRAVGEASVGYMVSPYAAEAIAGRIPEARILMILRSPVDRAFSHYLYMLSEGLIEQSFRQYVRACLRHRGEGLGIHEPFLDMGFYAGQVQRYLSRFPRDRVRIWTYEDYVACPRELLRTIFRFIGVEEGFEPDMSVRYHQPRIPKMVSSARVLRWARMTAFSRKVLPARARAAARNVFYSLPGEVKMDAADRALMLEFYSSDIRRLEKILDRDLSGWLR